MPGRGPIRQSQLIAPFGPGALHTDRFGTTLICCGLDYWFKDDHPENIKEFIIDDEWRLQRDLGVNHLRRPPDYRISITGTNIPNTGMTIPFLRFPTWHYCIECGQMKKLSLTYQGLRYQSICSECLDKKGRKVPMVQVRFVAICEHGHIQDFPWSEWTHHSITPECGIDYLKLRDYRGTLESITVKCTKCGKSNNLSGITSDVLRIEGQPFECKGQRLWLHDEIGVACGLPVRGSLRNASNLYFAKVASSIFIPRNVKKDKKIDRLTADLLYVLSRPGIGVLLDTLLDLDVTVSKIIKKFREHHEMDFKEFTDEEIKNALNHYSETKNSVNSKPTPNKNIHSPSPKSFRFEEYQILKQEIEDPALMSRMAVLNSYKAGISDYFSRIMLIHKLRETRAFTGFTRINHENNQSPSELKKNLWLEPPPSFKSWLPACKVFGEGLFFEMKQKSLDEWLAGPNKSLIKTRIDGMQRNFMVAVNDAPGFALQNEIHPIFVMIHTLAHLLINQLTFECGYSSASLRERLYFSSDSETPMAGFLIYTAAGDSEGTMGGLVRMGKAGLFEPLLIQALRKSQWCSADPVCMELGAQGGQGTHSCNLAACHNCALVPETSCEEFNRFLDRGVVTGTVENRSLGFFNTLLEK
ncbi:MAG: DUF1998 domain-containing protein [Desulfosalsimonadaceae bacterium]